MGENLKLEGKLVILIVWFKSIFSQLFIVEGGFVETVVEMACWIFESCKYKLISLYKMSFCK